MVGGKDLEQKGEGEANGKQHTEGGLAGVRNDMM